MTVRRRLALTILLTGLATALGVIVTVAIAFQRFEHQNTWQRADAFLSRVVVLHDDLLDQHQRNPGEFSLFLRNLLLYEPDTQLYLLDAGGTVLAHTGRAHLAPGFKVALPPVRQAVDAAARGDRQRAAYVMGDDPESMDADAVVAARALQRALIRRSDTAAGYLYLVSRQPGRAEPAGPRWRLLVSSLATPALAAVLAVIALTTALAAWIITTVTRPLRVLSDDVAAAAREGFDNAASSPTIPLPPRALDDDEFNRLRSGFHALLATLRMQWDQLRRLDQFRRESVSNLSHDLRSPLTATVACLETLEQRWLTADVSGISGMSGSGGGSGSGTHGTSGTGGTGGTHGTSANDDRRLIEVALRNARNAAAMVRALGDLALLDEPEFKLHPMRVDLGDLLDDIVLRFADRAARQGVSLHFEQQGSAPPVATVDIELFERALANLLDNALKFTPAGKAVVLGAQRLDDATVRITLSDQGSGIAAADVPHLFDRLYQSRSTVAPASNDDGKGLGLAIVKRIVELHRGTVALVSAPGQGTTVTLELPAG